MNAVIVEDEALAARNLQIVLDELGTVDVIATIDSVKDTVKWFHSHAQPDLLFLDIHLADGSAFEIFDRTTINCPIIFTTAYDEYALKAFKVSSIDYLLKPIDKYAIINALNKLRNLSNKNNAPTEIERFIASYREGLKYKTHFLIPVKGDKLMPLQASEIAYLNIDAGIVKVNTMEEKIFRLEYTLDEIEGMLNPTDFFRANRQYIISRRAIKDLDFWFNGRLSLNLKTPVSVKILISKARVPEFKEWFSGK